MPSKIFIGNNPLYLCETGFKLPPDEALELSSAHLTQEKFTDENSLLKIIEQLENKNYKIACIVFHKNENELLRIFNCLFKPIAAAGGLVLNEKSETLMIFRKGKWDLPKGKIEMREEKKEAALREVEEETGLKKATLGKQIYLYSWKQEGTLHAYWENKKRILKTTYWFQMKSTGNARFTPQKAEGITEVKWIDKKEIQKVLKQSYGSVADVLRYNRD